MKKILVVLLIIVSALISCKKNEYHEMKVYPIPKELSVPQNSESFMVIQVELPSHTHIYGNPKGPGTGKPTEVTVKAPAGLEFGAARFLEPDKFYFPGEKEYTWGYEDETRIYIPFTVRAATRMGINKTTVTFDSLLCTDTISSGGSAYCIPKLFIIDCPIRILPQGSAGTAHNADIVAEYAASSAPAGGEKDDIALPPAGEKDSGAGLLSGLSFSPRYMERGVTGILQAILFGIIAGFILNFMPCVLPVVSLKVMSFVQNAGRGRRELFLLGLIFSLGILTSFGALAALAAFFGYRWGGLFQHRLFLVAMTGIVFALALSLFGVYTINVPAVAGRAIKEKANRYGDAYVKGLLATILATPCSGPFLGGTLAWTLSQPPSVIVIVFLCIGMGMALPYLVLTANPGFIRFIPKPGDWLKTFEQVMGFLLVFTVIYLIGIFEAGSILPVVAFLGFVAIGFWQYGRYGAPHRTSIARSVSTALLVIIIATGYFLSFHFLYREEVSANIDRKQFSVQRIMSNREEGRISVIEFTADWCPNCRLVEKTALQSGNVASALGSRKIDFMVADITKKNVSAERIMSMFKSESIPLLAVVPPGESFNKPIILRDLYSADDVLKAIHMAGGKN
ncbi:MAG: hypothetical protein JW807_00980 [Spirochaetes bacterium]|nr:hypothetical protein [Spirochaetota bacterium]